MWDSLQWQKPASSETRICSVKFCRMYSEAWDRIVSSLELRRRMEASWVSLMVS